MRLQITTKDLRVGAALLILLFALLLGGLGILGKRGLLPPELSLFNALLPTWGFFADLGHVPELQARVAPPGTEDFGEWFSLLPEQKVTWKKLFANPEGNLRHACDNLVDRLAAEASTSPDRLSESTSYRLVENLVKHQLHKKRKAKNGAAFQFKILVRDLRETAAKPEDLLISETHEL